MAEPEASEHSRQLADEAAQRGWQYSPSGDHLSLPRRWKWSARYEHPFELKPQQNLGLDRRSERIGDVVSGTTPAGRPFWAFWYKLSDNVGHGFASSLRRSVAFIYTATSLPTVSVASRDRSGSITAAMQDSIGERMRRHPAADTERAGRTFGWAVGSEEFQRRYRVKADDQQSAEWLAGPAIEQALLGHQPPISLTSNGGDVLAWTDYGWTDWRGVTEFGGRDLSPVEDLDIPTVEALLEILDAVPLRA